VLPRSREAVREAFARAARNARARNNAKLVNAKPAMLNVAIDVKSVTMDLV
jgi:hypothetical protein